MSAILPAATDVDWEASWAPYDEATYKSVLSQIRPDDIVLDIGAGDLRLARRMAAICRRVYAIEIQPALIRRSPGRARLDPHNLFVLQGDARRLEFPRDVTVGVLLMRHCTHYNLYARKLKQSGAQRLLTNARWRMDVESVLLQAQPLPYREAGPGWYACGCGTVGFKCHSIDSLSPEAMATTTEVVNCPSCNPP